MGDDFHIIIGIQTFLTAKMVNGTEQGVEVMLLTKFGVLELHGGQSIHDALEDIHVFHEILEKALLGLRIHHLVLVAKLFQPIILVLGTFLFQGDHQAEDEIHVLQAEYVRLGDNLIVKKNIVFQGLLGNLKILTAGAYKTQSFLDVVEEIHEVTIEGAVPDFHGSHWSRSIIAGQ
jgi:hypothetical protein